VTPTLRNKVVVITGASSGLGRAAAVEFARRGAQVVIAARRLDALEETARQCRAAGGDALICVTDVTRESDVEALLRRGLEVTGEIDVWVNNAGITVFAPLEGTPFDEHRRVLETNVYGSIFGARVVVPVFRKQKRGVLINVSSILGKIGQPFVPSYVISKFAIRGLSEALRAELAREPNIHVCCLYPYAIDTPHFQAGANRMGRSAHPLPPVQSPEKVALALVSLAEHPRRELHVPRLAAFGLGLHMLFPRSVERLLHDVLARWHFSENAEGVSRGNLWQPDREAAEVHGHRPSLIGTSALAGWVVRYLFARQAKALKKAVGGLKKA
jgi:NAD(P)-dependent dehydrogenase (short-subunit alcohol dehydrogenase family)